PGLRATVLAALPPADATLEAVCRIDTGVGQEFAAAAEAAAHDLAGDAAELVVSHGQPLYHWASGGAVHGTLQLGQPAWIAEATGLPVVSDVRVNDVAAGGQGAPLASLLDVLLLGDRPGPTAALNLGGIANLTVVGAKGGPVAFDTGPANALLDAAMRRVTGGALYADLDGALAARGRVDEGLLAALLDHPYYHRPPPKTTGKEAFHAAYLSAVLGETGLDATDEDLLATLVELTARTVADALAPYGVREVYASGGGTLNPTLMSRLAVHLAPARLTTSGELGLHPGAKEAHLFALLGFLTWNGLPGTVPGCTGARRATVAGRITPGALPLRLPDPVAEPPTHLTIVS
ncbi:MAG: anhydro-N-acetylmuramic acid kinase, partial [Actinomycetota bacterium]|nr:anhydro-N-acetylmuramic acid kinase [Actinomycetota bacterium]